MFSLVQKFRTSTKTFFLFAFAATTLASCEKEPLQTLLESEPIAVEDRRRATTATISITQKWLLLEATCEATKTENLTAPTVLKISNPMNLAGMSVPFSAIPASIKSHANSLNLTIPTNPKCWKLAQSSGGGFIIEIPMGEFPTKLLWYNGQGILKTIGKIIP